MAVGEWNGLLSLVIIFCCFSIQNAQNFSHEDRLFHTLFTNYNSDIRPIADSSKSVNVSMSLQIIGIDNLDEKNQVFATLGWYWAHWVDPRLTWEPNDYGGLKNVIVPATYLWLPTFALENTAAEQLYDPSAFLLFKPKVHYTGLVSWAPTRKFKTSCAIQIKYYPFDDQICVVKFTNWFYLTDQVDLYPTEDANDILLEPYLENNAWEIVETAVERHTFIFPEMGTYPSVNFKFHLRRKTLFYTMNLILPCVMISMLVLLVNKLPSDSGEKISMGVTLLLSFSVFILMVSENIPNSSEGVPLIVAYLITIMGMTAMSVMNSVVVLANHHSDGSKHPPRWLQKLACILSRLLCMDIHLAKKDTQDKAASRMNSQVRPSDAKRIETKGKNDIEFLKENHSKLFFNYAENPGQNDEQKKENNSREAIREDWRAIAKIIDSTFFYINLFIFLVSTVFALVIVPLDSSLSLN